MPRKLLLLLSLIWERLVSSGTTQTRRESKYVKEQIEPKERARTSKAAAELRGSPEL